MSSYQLKSDLDLLELIQQGDAQAFSQLYDRYAPLMYVYARKIISEREDVEDAIQEIFLGLWQNKTVLIHTSVSSFLYTAVRYKLFDLIDKQTVRRNHLQSLQSFIDRKDFTPEERLRERELAKRIEQEIDRLPQKMRRIFLLSRQQNRSYKEIALELEISDKTVKKQVSNALKLLRMRLTSFLHVILF